MSRSSSRGGSGMSASSSSSTLVQSSTSHSFSQYHHRHSSSLPSFNFYHRNSSPTSPKYSDQSQQLQQQQYAECASNPISNLHQTSDPTRPPIHRMLSHDTVLSHKPISTSISPKSQSYYSVSALPLPPPSSSSSFPTTMATATAGTIATGEECVEQHLMQTPLGDV
ncbi:hypothetical protein FBU30_006836 [Linnemannia zychae]|nr:hypothetical protein FBU30_006836 [Linnemannia zychae]